MILLCFRLILIVGPRPISGYLMFSHVFYDFPMVLLCFPLILIVGPRPIFGLSYAFRLFSIGFAMFLVDLDRRPLPDLGFFHDFLMILLCFRLSYDFLWFCIVFL